MLWAAPADTANAIAGGGALRGVQAAAFLPAGGGPPVHEAHQVQLYRIHDPAVCPYQRTHLHDVRE